MMIYRIVSTYVFLVSVGRSFVDLNRLYLSDSPMKVFCAQPFAKDREPFYNEETGAFPLTPAVANMYLLNLYIIHL